jgi:hypothetical protein
MNGANQSGTRTRIVARRDRLSTSLGGEAVVLDLDSGTYYGLNETGARIWHLLSQPIPLTSICEHLMEEYEIEPDACRAAVQRLVDNLLAADLVEVVDGEN